MRTLFAHPFIRLITTLVIAAAAGVVLLSAIGWIFSSGSDSAEDAVVLVEGAAVAIAPRPDGGFVWANIDGTVHDESGAVIGEVSPNTVGQRGLLGIAVGDDGAIHVAYTDEDSVLVVSELDGSNERRIWNGPVTVTGGNGGRLLFDQGRLILGVGLLNDREAQADPTSIVGAMIALDPSADPEQTPEILSGPWNNPFAFDTTPAGELWVADNHPRDGDERLARGDLGFDPEPALILPTDSAPTGLVALDDAFFVCSYNTQTLDRYQRADDGSVTFDEVVADDCLLDVAVLTDGTVIYSSGSAVLALPG